ncbi:hypothetical protein [Xenorhabdus griffiniae]|uniref:hypothetical protein n=1 Tax=Xenorhabdus griffiniae TaxID=351672 RepID=UPI00235929CE|nr:hypothetical protein [Xenorhabdus griffiniae]MDC9607354.1 hypothetical protein [Xenorhabdus griffiniae]
MPKHIHADLIMEYAKLAQETDKPWEHFQYGAFNCVDNVIWTDCDRAINFDIHLMYRLKPRTIKIGVYDVPEPVREPLPELTHYYLPDIYADSEEIMLWDGGIDDITWLQRGLIHLDLESAELHAKALIALTSK